MIVLIAHDGRKKILADWVRSQETAFGMLSHHYKIGATQSTALALRSELGIPINWEFSHGPEGGDVEVGAAILAGKVDAIIFFWDPLGVHPHADDVRTLLRIATLKDIPVACNPSTADCVLNNLWDRIYI